MRFFLPWASIYLRSALHRRLDRHRLDGKEKLSTDRGIDP